MLLDLCFVANTFRRKEIMKHYNIYKDNNIKKENPWYLIIDNKVYDVKDFIPDHPGGAVILTHIGKDATGKKKETIGHVILHIKKKNLIFYYLYIYLDAFHNFHPKSSHEILANFYVGDLVKEDVITVKEGRRRMREKIDICMYN